ncbi:MULTISPECIES: hypothetical protein [unclassified Coleofasciculus]|uniref:hypothetical protein n=1 Tax=Cyanophyceae TaxID=3028117 RepID=UPI0018F0140F|nr:MULTISPECIES: hypothetical protein [unclassified Coleofasciculus]
MNSGRKRQLLEIRQLLLISGCSLFAAFSTQPGQGKSAPALNSNRVSLPRQLSACPNNLENLTLLLLRDLPSYANRVNQRARRRSRKVDISSSSVIIAGRPEFEPLSLGPGQYTPTTPAELAAAPKQLFITTLERQYTAGKAIELQQYHWLFLAQTDSGWSLALMFSRTGPSPGGRPPTPPRDSSNGIIGQAVRNWLQDCRVGKVRSL